MPPTLYVPSMEHDSCGIGFVAHIKGRKSHQIVQDGLTMLINMEHRGGCGCEPETGDGAGILFQVPHQFLATECQKLGFVLPEPGKYGVGMMFFNPNVEVRQATKQRIQEHLDELGFNLLGYRPVPVNHTEIGETARQAELPLEQIFVSLKENPGGPSELERKLFILRKYTTHSIGRTSTAVPGNDYEFYWLSLSYKTIVYKGMLRTTQLADYFPDLAHPDFDSALALVHSRFSTNTVPKWKLAQPFRYIAHNGEINTIRGNINWMKSKQAHFISELFTPEEFDLLLPICDKAHSDSANLDSIIEMLTLAGRSLPHAMMMVIPEAWEGHDFMDEDKKAFYEYHASLMEPWDGPASISFTDGHVIGATLDRNGLRPSRYVVTQDDIVVMASEAGALPVEEERVIKKGRLQPGRMFVVDLQEGRIIEDEELKTTLAHEHPYREWLDRGIHTPSDLPEGTPDLPLTSKELLINQRIFGYTREDLKKIIGPMANAATEPIGSMGADIPLPPFSHQSQHLSNYFKQLFAQVSNPPIDPIREKMIMSLRSSLGMNLNALDASPDHCRQLVLEQPVLTKEDLGKIKVIDQDGFTSRTLPMLFSSERRNGLELAIDQLCRDAAAAVESGRVILILSDRKHSSSRVPIPSLLALGAVHQYLIRTKLRAKSALVVEAGDVRETHHFATLIGYGANAICPYLAFESIDQLWEKGLLNEELTLEQAHANYIKAIGYGLRKIFSKMGISTLQSYHGAQIFEILGLNSRVVKKCFTKSVSRIEGLGFGELENAILKQHRAAFSQNNDVVLEAGGIYEWRKDGEKHLFGPEAIHYLQKAARNKDYDAYKTYANLMNSQDDQVFTIRGLLEFQKQQSIPLEEVEPAVEIMKRFCTGAMSFGSISYEAHSTLAIAMNRIGAKSNSGEGGEDENRFERKPNGDWERSAIKQVASGRFGVTSNYLTNASEIQIKMAQGAKPGEGGQLPGHKVDEWIGRVRYSIPGVGLISPPPHHDIYSIEDLAQLIYDLKRANREARINVKLVSEAGVGTIASGVAKAKADVVLISGYDGGTGASPISSIKHAGLPWEIGLAETHQTLLRNKLRNRITVQTDGQIRTGRDLAIATLLGAEEWGIATAALVVEGCILMRKCHLNTCPVGVATQNPELRKRFKGKPEHVVNFFTFLAEDLREVMASLGFRTVNEMVGHTEVLTPKAKVGHNSSSFDFSALLAPAKIAVGDGSFKQREQDHELFLSKDWSILNQVKGALENRLPVKATFDIMNTDRSVGAIISNEISKKYKGEGLPHGTIHLVFKGSAGQSFGVFGVHGITFELEGEANDYFGKGLSGAEMIIYPHKVAQYDPEHNQIIGNVAFYGATSGTAFIRGLAGERFCVRNSGVKAVVEGIGDHGCEYMTGGVVVVLGDTGRNFAAGMSGGIAYVMDHDGLFKQRCNMASVDLDPPEETDLEELQDLIHTHWIKTESSNAERILKNWARECQRFIKVMPKDYKKALRKLELTTA